MIVAYIDPGAGSIVLQIVLAGILSAGIVFRRVILWPFLFLFGKGKFARSNRRSARTNPTTSEDKGA